MMWQIDEVYSGETVANDLSWAEVIEWLTENPETEYVVCLM